MELPFTLPDWMPWWLQLVLVVLGLLLLLAFALMPFSVFGVKSRLETIEARLDEVQSELRRLSLRLPEGGIPDPYEDEPPIRAAAPLREPAARPPIPPAAWPEAPVPREPQSPTMRAATRVAETVRTRAEPKLTRPK